MLLAKAAMAALALVLAGVTVYAQTGALAVNIQGSVFDRGEPPGPATAVSPEGELGARIIISPTSEAGFNLALFTENSNSTLFKTFRYPGNPMEASGVRVPGNAFLFFGTVQDGNFAGDLMVFSGEISADDPKGPQNLLYSGTLDNPLTSAPDSAPVYSWDFVEDGIAGNGDHLACQEARGPLPRPGFVVVIERGKCLFSDKVQNAARAGAIAAIVYNHEEGGNNLAGMATPGASIPSVFLRRQDGLDLARYADDNRRGPATIAVIPKNLLGSANGSFKTNTDGVLDSVTLNLLLSDQEDHIFAGRVNR